MNNSPELNALISLLDDPDPDMFSHIKQKLEELGYGAIDGLEHAWSSNQYGLTFQNRVEDVIHSIQFKSIKKELDHWSKSDRPDLLEGALILSKYQYPDFNRADFFKELDKIEKDIWIELNSNLTAMEQIRVINHILFDVYKFSGNTKNYHSPQNSFISSVVETKKGNPLSLSILYSHLCQKLKLPVFGINLPKHFILGFADQAQAFLKDELDSDDILFYINPFSQGGVFGKDEIYRFCEQLKIDPAESFFKPCGSIDMIYRALFNLSHSYNSLGNKEKVNEINELMNCIKSKEV